MLYTSKFSCRNDCISNVFNNPLATYSAFPAVSTAAASCELVEDEVNLNVLSPVLHLGLLFTFGSGIEKVPDTLPFASVIKLPPSEPFVGVHVE